MITDTDTDVETGTLIEVESLDAAHAYLMATPAGSPWEVTP